jgi:hypothetical protein
MPASTCEISGEVCTGDGQALVGSLVKASVKSTSADMGGQVIGDAFVSSTDVEAFSEGAGAFTITLIQGGVYLLEIPDVSLRKEITVPAAGTANLIDLV